MPACERLVRDLSDRPVAKTLSPLDANSRAKELPAPPFEHLAKAESHQYRVCRAFLRPRLAGEQTTYPVMSIERFVFGTDIV